MERLFFKVFKNVYIRDIIFKKVKEINDSLYYLTFNFYQLSLLSTIKIRNESLLFEKLNLYNKYICNSSFEIKYNYYLDFDKSCFMELLKWNGINIEIIKLIFKLFEKEIKEFEIIESITMDTIKLIIEKQVSNNLLLQFIINQRKQLNLPIYSNLTILQLLDFIITQKKTKLYASIFLNMLTLPQLQIMNESSTNVLIPIENINFLTRNIFIIGDKEMFKLLLSKLIELYNIKFDINSKFETKKRYFNFKNKTTGEIEDIEFNDQLIDLMLIDNEMLYSSNLYEVFNILVIDDYQSNSKFKINKDGLISKAYKYISGNSFSNSNKNPIYINNRKIAKYIIKNYTIDNSFLFGYGCLDYQINNTITLKSNQDYFKIFQEKNLIFSIEKNIIWKIDYNNPINRYQIKFLLSNQHIHLKKNYVFEQVIENNDYELLLLWSNQNIEEFKKFLNHTNNYNNTIMDFTNYDNLFKTKYPLFCKIIKFGNSDIVNILLPSALKELSIYYGDFNYYTFKLLFLAIEYENDQAIDLIYQLFKNNKKQNNQVSNDFQVLFCLINELPFHIISKYLKIIKFIESLLFRNNSTTTTTSTTNNFKIISQINFKIYESSLNYNLTNDKLYEILLDIEKQQNGELKDQNIKKTKQKLSNLELLSLLDYLFKSNNVKLIQQLILLKGPMLNCFKQKFLKRYLQTFNDTFSNSLNFKIILFLLSINFFNLNDLSLLIKCLIKFKNIKLLNILLCINNNNNNSNHFKQDTQTVPFQQPKQITFDFYINLVHFYILKFSIKLNNLSIIEYLVDKICYKYKPSTDFINNHQITFKNNLTKINLDFSSKIINQFLKNTSLIEEELIFDFPSNLQQIKFK